MPITSINGEPIVVERFDRFLTETGRLSFASGYVKSDTPTTINPGTATVSSSSTVGYVFCECKAGDVFEVDVTGGSAARAYVVIAGADSDTPYAVLSRMPANVTLRSYIVVTQPDAGYVLFHCSFASNSGGFVRKVPKVEYLAMRSQIGWEWLSQHRHFDGRYLKEDGSTYTSTEYVVSPFIPVRFGDRVEFCLSGTSNASLMLLYDSDFTLKFPIASGTAWNTPTRMSFVVPEDGWIRTSFYYSANARAQGDSANPELFGQFHLEIDPRNDYTESELLDNSYEQLEFLRASRMHSDGESKPLTLLHLSDLHGDTYNWRLIHLLLSQQSRFGQYVEDVILTGDIIYTNITNSLAFLDASYTAYAGDHKVLLAIGNHDVRPSNQQMYKYTESVTIEDTYGRYMDGRIDGWGVQTDPNADFPTYYYKDYGTEGFRLVVLDPQMDQSLSPTEYANQMAWFSGVMDSAKAAGLAVIVAQHFPVQGTPRYVQCSFTDLRSIGYTQMGDTVYNQSTVEEFQERVQGFIDGGGEFVCWLVGHNHADFVYVVEEYPEQLCVVVGTDSTRVDSTMADRSVGKAKSLFNAVTFSRTEKQIRLVRFGAVANRYMQRRLALTIDYGTLQVVAEA